MSDKLKDFIKNHRDEFDNREPSDRVWEGVQKGISGTEGGKIKSLWTSVSIWRAAAVIFLGLSVYLYFGQKIEQKNDMSKLQVEFRDLESFYGGQIAEKVAFIDNLDGYEDDRFTQDVQKLDAMYEVLREEMKTRPSEKVKDALILNMLVRIDLLNQQIKRLEDSRKENKEIEEII
ncbi:MAG TPA: hypothetical protein VK508_06650 [Cyclobacteriaceae bacterium]|nr:hypothetical protein [Cyclobacteriaceae bacterium]